MTIRRWLEGFDAQPPHLTTQPPYVRAIDHPRRQLAPRYTRAERRACFPSSAHALSRDDYYALDDN